MFVKLLYTQEIWNESMKDFLKFEKNALLVKKILRQLFIHKLQDIFLVLLPFLLILNIVVLRQSAFSLQQTLDKDKLHEVALLPITVVPYPILTIQPVFFISAGSAVVVD